MATISLLSGRGQQRTQIGALTLDAAESIDHELSAAVTKNPVESGSVIQDHVTIDNDKITINGIVSEAPISILGSAFNVFTGAAASQLNKQLGGFARGAAAAGIGSIGGIITNRNQNDVQFPQKAYNYLKELLRAREPFTIVTSLERYSNMVCTKLSVPQRASTGKSLIFNATFEKVNLVKTKTVLVPESVIRNASGASNTNLGNQPRTEASADNARGVTVLKSIFNQFGAG